MQLPGGNGESAEHLGEHERILHEREPLPGVHPVQAFHRVVYLHVGVRVLPPEGDPLQSRLNCPPCAAGWRGRQLAKFPGPLGESEQTKRRSGSEHWPVSQNQRGSRDVVCHPIGQRRPLRVAAKCLLELPAEQLRLAEARLDKLSKQVYRAWLAQLPSRERTERTPQVRPELIIVLQVVAKLIETGPVLGAGEILRSSPQLVHFRIRQVAV